MIVEVAILDVRAGQEAEFESAFRQAYPLISEQKGFVSLELQRCLETPNRYLLLVRWQTLTDHTEGFRGSPQYQRWKALLHHFYDPFPRVEHFQAVRLAADQGD
ncbi:MAG: antibiotic biosynthesis monooxygenase [Candidatus Promineifilaceae bacterium]|nr:antibiotic biosynthesis monooxygenase [Candidatus Promineifilaceae bacterium]